MKIEQIVRSRGKSSANHHVVRKFEYFPNQMNKILLHRRIDEVRTCHQVETVPLKQTFDY